MCSLTQLIFINVLKSEYKLQFWSDCYEMAGWMCVSSCTKQVGSSGSASSLYLAGTYFKSWLGHWFFWRVFPDFSQSHVTNARVMRPLPSMSISVYISLITNHLKFHIPSYWQHYHCDYWQWTELSLSSWYEGRTESHEQQFFVK